MDFKQFLPKLLSFFGQDTQTNIIIAQGGPAVEEFYKRLGTTEQNMMNEMLLQDQSFQDALANLNMEGAGEEGLLDGVPDGVVNTIVRELYNDPNFRADFVAGLTPSDADAAPSTDAQPVLETSAAPGESGNFLQDMVNNLDIKNFMSGLMEMPFLNQVMGLMENFMGKIFGFFDDLFNAAEVMVQSNSLEGLGRPGQILASFMDPQALVHSVSPQNEISTRPAGEMGQPTTTPTTPTPEQRPGMEQNQTPGFTMG